MEIINSSCNFVNPIHDIMRPHIKTGTTERTYTVDEHGTVIDEEVKYHKYLAATKEQFFIGYVSMLGMIYKELTGPEIKVYAYLLEKYSSESGIGMVKALKEEMSKIIGIKLGTIDNALSGLVRKTMLYTTGKAMYKMNPRYAFKGPTALRNKVLKAVLEFECPHC